MSLSGAPGSAIGTTLRYDSLARGAADWIAAHIISGDITPGEKLTETSLAEQMGISRSPVREALQELSRDGLIILEPRRGARVNRLHAQDAADLYTCRLLIEPTCTELAAAALTGTAAAELENTFSRMAAAVAARDTMEYVDALKHYNWSVLAACPNRRLSDYAQSSWRGALRYWDLLARASDDYPAESLARNEGLHTAIRARAGAEARQAAAGILEHGRDTLLRMLGQLSADEHVDGELPDIPRSPR
ncbi:MAG TPA: GntR family transcriptional regulator [Trebonia sp.]|jgi:DNA-binding GntR family transcriptional regulator